MLRSSLFVLFAALPLVCAGQDQTLAGTEPLTIHSDFASNIVAGARQFLLRKTEESAAGCAAFWHRDFSSYAAYEQSLATNRQRLAFILGVRDQRVSPVKLELVSTPTQPALCGRGPGYEVFAVRWPAFGDVTGEGLLLTPIRRTPVANVVAIPDADQTPEQLAGLSGGIAPESQFARRLAESGCRVIIPALISRNIDPQKKMTDREFIYRPAYELGRHVIGYEIEKVQAAIDWMSAQNPNIKTGVVGWGEGGLLAFYTAALDTRIFAACVSGFFEDRRIVWTQPVYRHVFGLLEQFGDAEVAAMIAPRSLIIEAAMGPQARDNGSNGTPGILASPSFEDVRPEFARARSLVAALKPAPRLELIPSAGGTGPFGSEGALSAFLFALSSPSHLSPSGRAPALVGPAPDNAARLARQLHELDRHNQWLLSESPYARQKFMSNLDTSSPDALLRTALPYRDVFYREIMGRFDDPVLPPHPRSRKIYDQPKWTGYEVLFDVFPDVSAYGILLLPKDLKPGERRPVVVCQHGRGGRSQDVITNDSRYYHDYAARLCDLGFITFAPQDLYIFEERFRTLQRIANPLGKSLYSIMIPQHQQITDWLKTLPFVDPARIGFYGVSYGGNTGMRVPVVVTNYCLSICSANFNDAIWKNASTRSPYSFALGPEYEMFEFDLGSTFGYAEMASLIAPRPFMVERGHFDGTGPDESIGHEFAKVRFLYEARLHLPDRCAIEWFNGAHTVNEAGTFTFLRKHLDWPAP
jgi:dienelactone hydrolase